MFVISRWSEMCGSEIRASKYACNCLMLLRTVWLAVSQDRRVSKILNCLFSLQREMGSTIILLAVLSLSLVLIVLPASVAGASELRSGGRSVGAPRGISALNIHVFDKILDPTDPASAAFRLEKIVGDNVYSLRNQLGTYSAEGGQNSIKGDKVNPFNLLIWQRIVDEFAAAVGSECDSSPEHFLLRFANAGTIKVDPRVATLILALCNPLATNTDRRLALKNLWDAFVGYGLTAERDAWVTYFMRPEQLALSGREGTTAMFWTMMMHPYFYLER